MRTGLRLTLLGSALFLAGCSNTAEVLGLGRNSPDEFSVVDRAPLSLPPDYELRPPQPGVPRPQDIEVGRRASTVLFGETQESAAPTEAEKALLEAAGADKADPSIRTVIDREADQRIVGSRYLLEELLGWKPPSDKAPVVDAPAEAARIKDAKEKNGSLTDAPTPVIEKKRSGWLF